MAYLVNRCAECDWSASMGNRAQGEQAEAMVEQWLHAPDDVSFSSLVFGRTRER
jgi:hypothetical protein